MDARKKWDALTQEQRNKLLEDYRYFNVDYDWWDGVYDTFKDDMEQIGIRADKIYFTGFYSQGDGACFEGHVTDWGKFLTACGEDKAAKFFSLYTPDISMSWTHHGRYYHEECTSFTYDLGVENPHDEEDDPLRFTAYDREYSMDGPITHIDKDLIEFVKGQMRDLYRQLEEEYEGLTSDEAVIETIFSHAENELDELLEEAVEI